jgi:cytochrome c peroxidase
LRGTDPAAECGVGDATLRPADLDSFKSPSLRNVEVTAPYGHDGRFATLDGLIDHYSDNPILDPNLGYIVSRHKLPRSINEATSSSLFGEMKALLDDEEYENFVAATARLSRRPPVIIK